MVNLSKEAAEAFKQACEAENRNHKKMYLRLMIHDNTATLYIESNTNSGDHVYKEHGIKIIIDDVANTWLHNASIEYLVLDDGREGFRVTAPDLPEASACGSCAGDVGCC